MWFVQHSDDELLAMAGACLAFHTAGGDHLSAIMTAPRALEADGAQGYWYLRTYGCVLSENSRAELPGSNTFMPVLQCLCLSILTMGGQQDQL